MLQSAQSGCYRALPLHLAPAQMAMLIAQFGGSVTSQTPHAITGAYRTRGDISMIAAIILFLMCIVPFIVYLLSANKDIAEPLTVTAVPDGPGTRMYGSGQGRGLWCAEQAAMAMPR